MGFFAVFIGAFFLLRFATKEAMRASFKIAFWGLWIAGIVYTLLVMCNYLFFFSEYEAVRLASLSRYLNTYIVGMVMLLCGWFAAVLPGKKMGRQLLVGAGAVALWAMLANPGVIMPKILHAPTYAVMTSSVQNQYTDAANAIRAVSGGEEVPKVYVIAKDDIGATIPRLEYELAPGYLPTHTTSIATDVPKGEILSQKLSPKEWADLLQAEYEYVYLFKVDNAFAAEYGMLFPGDETIVDGGMFRVVPAEDGILLELVDVA